MTARVLVVDDDYNMLRYMRTLLRLESHQVHTANSGGEAIEKIQQGLCPDLVFLDMLMPGMDGLETLEHLRQLDPSLKIAMLSCVKETAKIVQAMRLGAKDYVNKPLDGAALDAVLRNCLHSEKSAEAGLDGEGEELPGGVSFVAGSPEMRKIRSQIEKIAKFDVPVLILGESGVGKEVAALLIHRLSGRKDHTFMKVNCAAIPAGLLESELFGYEAGAFTGANQAKPGKFESCNGGTILLDEIGELPPMLQAKLLQVLQEQKFFRLGGRAPVSVNVRILAATNIEVEEALKNDKLRLDLYYRLNTFAIHLPPLRQRRDDIPLLVRHFATRLSTQYNQPMPLLSEQMLEACARHHWPGNIRELQNFVKRYVVLGDESAMLAELQGPRGKDSRTRMFVRTHDGKDLKRMVKDLKQEAEAQVIAQALQEANWDRSQAAALLNISYKALVYKARQYGLDLPKRGTSAAAATASQGGALREVS